MRWPYPRTPELGRNLPRDYQKGEVEFDRRVKAQFPRGTGEACLIAQLRNEGFLVDQTKSDCNSATITRGVVMKTLWSVRWRAKEGHIDDVWGVYGAIAP